MNKFTKLPASPPRTGVCAVGHSRRYLRMDFNPQRIAQWNSDNLPIYEPARPHPDGHVPPWPHYLLMGCKIWFAISMTIR